MNYIVVINWYVTISGIMYCIAAIVSSTYMSSDGMESSTPYSHYISSSMIEMTSTEGRYSTIMVLYS